MKLSVIIPSWKDKYLIKTIQSLLDNSELGSDLELIIVLDGYWREDIQNDPRVKILHLGANRGMRGAINAGVSISKGKFIMRTDEHCVFGKGYDRIMTDACEPNWIMTAKRFFLDPVKWEVMDLPPVEYERLRLQTVGDSRKFCGIPTQRPDRDGIMVDETQAMQGSMWLMSKKWWETVIVELQSEGYGTHLQDSHEMVFKTWKAGGKLMLNKNTWFAHKHVSFPRVHNYGGEIARKAVQYSYDTWKDYYREIKKTFTF